MQIDSLMDMEDDNALLDLLDEMHGRNEKELQHWNETSLARSAELDLSSQSCGVIDNDVLDVAKMRMLIPLPS